MDASVIIGFILLGVAIAVMMAADKQHRDETGVGAPTRNQMANIRRNARRKGISPEQAHSEWVARQQKKAGVTVAEAPQTPIQPHLHHLTPIPPIDLLEMQVQSAVQKEAPETGVYFEFEFHCKECSGYILETPEEGNIDGPVRCKACGFEFGTFQEVKAKGEKIAHAYLDEHGTPE